MTNDIGQEHSSTWRRTALQYFIIAAISTVLGLFSYEGWYQWNSFQAYREGRSEYGRWSSGLIVTLKHVAKGGEFFDVSPEEFSRRGLHLVTGIPGNFFTCMEAKILRTHFDQHGFRNSEEIWQKKDWKIAIVGDSFGFGACVEEDETIAFAIRQRYPKTINVSRAGSSPVDQHAILKEYLLPFRPKLVVWLFYEGNDLRQIQDYPSYAERYLDDPNYHQGLLQRNQEIVAIARQHNKLDVIIKEYLSKNCGGQCGDVESLTHNQLVETLRAKGDALFDTEVRSHSSTAIKTFFVRFVKLTQVRSLFSLIGIYVDATDISDQTIDKAALSISRSKTLVEAWGGRFVFVYLPESTRFSSGRWNKYHLDNMARLMGALRKSNLDIVDVSKYLWDEDNPTKYYAYGSQGGHFSPEGYQFVGKIILNHVEPFLQKK